MRVFLLDLWLDLREKRLAPVALALLAGLLLVPFVLAKGEPEAPPPPPAVAQDPDNGVPTVSLPEGDQELESRLTAFDPRDPFEPRAAAQIAAPDDAPAGGDTGGDTGAATGGGEGTGAGDTGTGTVGGGGTGGGTTGTGPGDTGATGGDTPRRTVVYTFTVDLLYGPFGEERRFNRVRRLELVPSEENPAVVFLGVTTSGKTAVFLVDDRFAVTGEGVCRPSPEECTFLYLRESGDRNSAILTEEDGTRNRLSLRDIDRVAVTSQARGEADDDNSASGDRSPAFTGSKDDQGPPPGEPGADSPEAKSGSEKRAFRSPVFADDER